MSALKLSFWTRTVTRLQKSNHVIVRGLCRINNFSKRHPVLLASGTSCLRCAFADIVLAQLMVEKRDFNDINWNRVYLFSLYGALYVGGFQYWIYGKVYPYFFDRINKTNPMRSATLQTICDLSTYSPFVYMPIFYVFKHSGTAPSCPPRVFTYFDIC